ncbi:hypothetical protein J4536_23385, partial [Escherichia coli]|nr:hypothetical protein [Escherichia coli]
MTLLRALAFHPRMPLPEPEVPRQSFAPVYVTILRAHETDASLECRLLLENKKTTVQSECAHKKQKRSEKNKTRHKKKTTKI